MNNYQNLNIYLILAFDNPHLRIFYCLDFLISCGVISLLSKRSFKRLNIVEAAALESCCPVLILTNASKFGSLLFCFICFISYIIFSRTLSEIFSESCTNACLIFNRFKGSKLLRSICILSSK